METKTIYLITINGDVFRAVDDKEKAEEMLMFIEDVFAVAGCNDEVVTIKEIKLLTLKIES